MGFQRKDGTYPVMIAAPVVLISGGASFLLWRVLVVEVGVGPAAHPRASVRGKSALCLYWVERARSARGWGEVAGRGSGLCRGVRPAYMTHFVGDGSEAVA